MEITLEKIDLLRKRANISYKEAKEALEKNDGNIVEALAYLEEQNKIKPEKETFDSSSLVQKVKNAYYKANKIRLNISKDNAIILNIPSPLALVVAIIVMPLAVVLLLLALVTGCKIRFTRTNGEECGINRTIENVSSKVNEFTEKVAQELKNP